MSLSREAKSNGDLIMLRRKYLFPNVIEMNYQAGHRLGVNVYLIDGGSEFVLIDIGYLDTVDEIVESLRARRERYGISYVILPGDVAESFAPVVERLSGT